MAMKTSARSCCTAQILQPTRLEDLARSHELNMFVIRAAVLQKEREAGIMLSHEREHAQIPVAGIKMSGVQEEGEHGLNSTSSPQCNVSLSILGGSVVVTLLDPWILYILSFC